MFLQAQNVGFAYILPLFAHASGVTVSLSSLVNQRLLIVCIFCGFAFFNRFLHLFRPGFAFRKRSGHCSRAAILHNMLWYVSGFMDPLPLMFSVLHMRAFFPPEKAVLFMINRTAAFSFRL